jgi:hypothetical protein
MECRWSNGHRTARNEAIHWTRNEAIHWTRNEAIHLTRNEAIHRTMSGMLSRSVGSNGLTTILMGTLRESMPPRFRHSENEASSLAAERSHWTPGPDVAR